MMLLPPEKQKASCAQRGKQEQENRCTKKTKIHGLHGFTAKLESISGLQTPPPPHGPQNTLGY